MIRMTFFTTTPFWKFFFNLGQKNLFSLLWTPHVTTLLGLILRMYHTSPPMPMVAEIEATALAARKSPKVVSGVRLIWAAVSSLSHQRIDPTVEHCFWTTTTVNNKLKNSIVVLGSIVSVSRLFFLWRQCIL